VAYKIVYSAGAIRDRKAIFDYLAERGGGDTASAFDLRIAKACARLSDFPKRGTPHDDLKPGLRSIALKRRVTIAFLVEEERVRILRILYAGQDLARAFGTGPDAER
jgi:toxin ParE1/3/4